MDEGWTICVDSRKQKRKQRRVEKELYSHIVSFKKAQQLQKKLNIDNLVQTLTGTPAQDLQMNGWVYTKVLRPDMTYYEDPNYEYTTIDNFNKWGDRLLFRRILISQELPACGSEEAEIGN